MDRVATAAGTGALLEKIAQNDNSRTGPETVLEYIGSQNECNLVLNQLKAQFPISDTSIKAMGDGPWRLMCKLPISFNGISSQLTQIPSIYELEVTAIQTPIYNSPKLRTLLTPEMIGCVSKVVNDFRAGLYGTKYSSVTGHNETALFWASADIVLAIDTAFTYGTGAPAGRTMAQCEQDGGSLFDAVALIGVEYYFEDYNVFRRTLTNATPFQTLASYTGAGAIWTTPEVQAFENINPNGWFYLNPTSQWRKSRPQVTASSGQKTQIVYSYTECSMALGLVYNAFSSATMFLPPA